MKIINQNNTTFLLVGCDTIAVFEVLWAQRFFNHGNWHSYTTAILMVLAVVLIGCLYSLDTYHLGQDRSKTQIIFLASIASGIFHVVQPFLFRIFDVSFSLAGVVLSFAVCLAYLFTTRLTLYWIRKKNQISNRILVLGEGRELKWADSFFEQLSDYKIIGYVSIKPTESPSTMPNLGKWQDLPQILESEQISVLCISYIKPLPSLLNNMLLHLKLKGMKVLGFSDLCQQLRGYIPLDYVDEHWFLFAEGFVSTRFSRQVKRISDFIFSLGGMVLLFPLAGAVALTNLVCNPGPLFYSQLRVGLYGREFRIFKFRTMLESAEKEGTPEWAQKDDDRATAWGQIMRKTHLDELPQIWNVLKGEMSIVGPRPERRQLIEKIEQEIPYYELRHFMKPGITGWAQVNLVYANSIFKTKWKLEYDLFYIRHFSLMFDLIIIARTVRTVLFGKGW
ncbi:MAG: sugar transferase [SAR324 cluster bacterium]|nr:sugar transferase [SAR324 cluster bacterium]